MPSRRSPPTLSRRTLPGMLGVDPGLACGVDVWGKSGVIIRIIAFPQTVRSTGVSQVRVTSPRALTALPGAESNCLRVTSTAQAVFSTTRATLAMFLEAFTEAIAAACAGSHRRSSAFCPMPTEGYISARYAVQILSLPSRWENRHLEILKGDLDGLNVLQCSVIHHVHRLMVEPPKSGLLPWASHAHVVLACQGTYVCSL